MLKTTGLTAIFFLGFFITVAQPVMDTTQRKATILIEQDANKVRLSVDTPPLIQISGAPEAFYTYFWEFGNGHYSFEEAPDRVYQDSGRYEVRLQVTNNYDNGKPPPSRPQTLKVGSVTHPANPLQQEEDFDGLAMLKNREPVPQEELVMVMRYKNEHNFTSSGKLYLYYNEKKFKANNFKLVDVRTHHNEQQVENVLLSSNFSYLIQDWQWASLSDQRVWPGGYNRTDSSEREHLFITVDESEEEFRDKLMLNFQDLAPKEKRNVFFTLQTTPEMIKDTSAIIKIRGVFVPDERSGSHQVQDLEMEITTSHDPNKMAVSDTRINYRLRKHKKIKYKVRFQNNGEGPASMIRLDVDVPSIIDKSTLEVLDMHPKCVICPDNLPQVSYSCLDTVFSEDQISFIFRNIYLPGSNQKGVEAYDSTKGLVKYKVKLREKAPKINSASRTAIIFDKNEPIITNYAKTHFKPGLSLGAMAGYKSIGALEESRDFFFGVTASPYMPYRGYLQAELILSWGSYKKFDAYEVRRPYPRGIDLDELMVVSDSADYEYLNITLVPASYRYNVNRFVGVGGGVQVSTKLYERVDRVVDYKYYVDSPNFEPEPNPDLDETVNVQETERITDFNPAVFAGFNVGLDRIGPRVGLRYVYQIKEPHSQWMFYAVWKF